MARVLSLAVFLSGEGTTCDALADQSAGGHLPARIALVLSDRPHAPGIERARHRGLPTAVRPLHGVDPGLWSSEIDALLHDRGVELVVLAGFLGIVPPELVRRWNGRILNVHPSLLPKYGGPGMYGAHVHRAVLADGEAESGATVHLVTDALDAGPILLQEAVPVQPGDTIDRLRDRLRPVETRLLSEAIRRFAEGDWTLPYPVPPASEAARPSDRDPI
ncbi:MAG: phosphoribosylglycinamide formyltransferase [Thermoplasmata archaeon]|nr:phosphoribosylglycinamide formyltransferase [Thermoplasmata archaeon]